MPQLDAATYRGQVFWLTIFFVGYYYVTLSFFLPALATRLKVRSKKVALSKGRLSSHDGERLAALGHYDHSLASSTSWVAGQLAASLVDGQRWRRAQAVETDARPLASANGKYLGALSAKAAQRLLAARL